MQQQGFWDRADRFRTLARFALMDRVKAAIGTARGLEGRLSRSTGPSGRYSKDLVARLASQLYVIQHGIDDALLDAAVEVVLTVQPVLDAAPDAATGRWCERLLDMYRRWASRRHMQWEEIPSTSSSPTMAVVSGFGAARILAGEAGLHVLEYGSSNEESARAVARVRMAQTPASVPHEQADKRTVLASELNKVPAPASVVRRYRLESSPLIRDVTHGWRTGRTALVMEGHFDLLADVLPAGD